jgi:hypothetical protein
MRTNRYPPTIAKLLHLFSLGVNVVKLLEHLLALIRVEARVAGKSLGTIAVLIGAAIALVTVTWLCGLGLLFLYLLSIAIKPIAALGILFILNVITLSVIILRIKKLKNNLLFPETCKQLHIVE